MAFTLCSIFLKSVGLAPISPLYFLNAGPQQLVKAIKVSLTNSFFFVFFPSLFLSLCVSFSIFIDVCMCVFVFLLSAKLNTVYTRVQVERVYKSNPIFEAKNTTFLEKV